MFFFCILFITVFLSFSYIGLHYSVVSFCLKLPESQCGWLGNEPAIIARLDFLLDRTARRRDLSGNGLVAGMLKEYADSGSVSDVIHIENDTILHFPPRLAERCTTGLRFQGLARSFFYVVKMNSRPPVRRISPPDRADASSGHRSRYYRVRLVPQP